jgi:hypothetical protein
MDITTIYVDIDNFCKYLASHLPEPDSSSEKRRVRQPEISDSEPQQDGFMASNSI